ncbi:hypothetical protein EDB89DRAFT_724516 [Lactarius sanguifluus]|nr:hypothetical protein EDB89DRAFT_724516 [Lactarius sanguifluus]
MPAFPALPGVYHTFFFIESVSTFSLSSIWFDSDAAGFRHELTPHNLEARTQMVIWQLGNCYMLLGLSSLFVFATIRDALPGNPVAQERILGALLSVMAVADVTK